MSGVRVGSRLEQLRKLRAQVDLQIEIEERRERLEGARPALAVQQPVSVRPRKGSLTGGVGKGSSSILIRDRLVQMGVTAKDVKLWAVEKGLLAEFKRGTVAVAVVDAYAEAHPWRAAGR